MTGVELEKIELTAALDRQQRLFQQSPSFLAVLRGPEHMFEFVNEAYMRLFGNRNFIGRRVKDVVPEAEPQGFIRLLDTVYRTGRTYRAQDQRFELVDPQTGQSHAVVLTFQYKALRDLNGRVSGIYAEGSDVTDRADDEAALEYIRQETQRRWAELESIYDNAPVGLAVLGAQRFEYRRLNKVQAEMIHLSPEQAVGKTVREVSPSVADAAEALFRRVVAGAQVRDVELEGELPQRPGERRSWIVGYAPIRLSDGTVDAIICTALETTERKRAERLATQNEKLAAVGRLAGSIAHEINNPLEAVTNLLYLARGSDDMRQTNEYLDAAEIELRRVAAITTQTLRFYKQASEPRCVTCENLLGSSLAIYQARIESLDIEVQRRKRATQPVLCFDGEIRQVLNNLVSNAIDAMIGTGGRLLVRSRQGTDWRTGRKGLWLTIADTGSGMPLEVRQRVFEPFFTTKGIAGTGLGLWISKEIVNRHHGKLCIRSSDAPGRHGTVSVVFLPFQAANR